MEELTAQLGEGKELGPAEVRAAATALLSDGTRDDAKADFLRALARKGESPAEISGFVEAFLARAVRPDLDRDQLAGPLLDVCGTGGDKLNLFNVSTTTIFILAAADICVVKHGNRGITSKSGGADVLETLGVRIDLGPEEFGRCVQETGMGFLFAPLYHPAFKAVVPVRQLLAKEGCRTIFNILGPLLNPVRPEYQLIGVFDGALTGVFATILASLGRKGGWAVHGTTAEGGGMDELSTLGPTTIAKLDAEGVVSEEVFDPAEFSEIGPATLEELQGGDAKVNGEILEGILEGRITGAKRDMVLLNAAAGLVITGKAADLKDGFSRAGALVDSGTAAKKLEALREFDAG